MASPSLLPPESHMTSPLTPSRDSGNMVPAYAASIGDSSTHRGRGGACWRRGRGGPWRQRPGVHVGVRCHLALRLGKEVQPCRAGWGCRGVAQTPPAFSPSHPPRQARAASPARANPGSRAQWAAVGVANYRTSQDVKPFCHTVWKFH